MPFSWKFENVQILRPSNSISHFIYDLNVIEEMKVTVKIIRLLMHTSRGTDLGSVTLAEIRMSQRDADCSKRCVALTVSLAIVMCPLTRSFRNPARYELLLSLFAKESTEGQHLPRGLVPLPQAGSGQWRSSPAPAPAQHTSQARTVP